MADVKDWVRSYLLVLIVSMCICSIFYLYAYLMVSEKTNEANEVALEIIASELNNTFEKISEIEFSIQSSESISVCEHIMLPLDSRKRIQLIQASNDMSKHLILFNDVIKEGQIYYPSNGMVLLGGGYYTNQEGGYQRLGQQLGYSQEEWESLLVQYHDRAVLAGVEEDTILYLSTLPKYGKNVKKNMVLIINTDYIQGILKKASKIQQGKLWLVSGNEQLLVSEANTNLNIKDLLEQLPTEGGYHRISINGKNNMMAYEKLEDANMLIVSIIPYKEYWSAALKSLVVFLIALGLCLVVGVAVSYFVSTKKQRLWGRLNDILDSKINASYKEGLSKDKIIADALDGIVNEYYLMQRQISSVENMKREVLLTAILRGRIRPEETEKILAKNNVKVELGNYLLVLFQIDNLNRFYDIDNIPIEKEYLESIQKSIMWVVQEFGKSNCSCEILSFDDKIVCIIDFGDLAKEDCYRWIEEFAEKISEEVRKSASFTISVSDIHRHVYSMFHAFSEALSVMEYQIHNEDRQMMYYREMVQKSQLTYLYSLEEEKALVYWIQAGKEKEALRLFSEILENNMVNTDRQESFTKCLIWNLAATVLRAEAVAGKSDVYSNTKEFLKEIKELNNVFDAKQIFKEKIVEICTKNRMKKENQDNLEERIKKYVEEHYSDFNLSNSEIANYFDLNVNYISGFFKEKTEMTLLGYIQKVRIEKAMELLVTTNMTLEKIGEETGFNNNVSFIRTFKKYEKITPTEYRKREREGLNGNNKDL